MAAAGVFSSERVLFQDFIFYLFKKKEKRKSTQAGGQRERDKETPR